MPITHIIFQDAVSLVLLFTSVQLVLVIPAFNGVCNTELLGNDLIVSVQYLAMLVWYTQPFHSYSVVAVSLILPFCTPPSLLEMLIPSSLLEMFPVDFDNLPFVQTRQALLILDVQTDFVAEEGLLPAENAPTFIENILRVLPDFRASSSGNVIFVRSIFEASRPINEEYGESEGVITDKEVLAATQQRKARRKPSRRQLRQDEISAQSSAGSSEGNPPVPVEARPDTIDETFLTVRPGRKQQMALAMSTGTNFAPQLAVAINANTDLVFQKTWYSAFKDGSLVQTLRAKFVTEIYVCGALTNISVYATAMDAARHGLAITIVEDCLGYRSKARHDEALKRLVEFTGCETITSAELIEELRIKAQRNKAPQPRHSRPQPRPRQQDSGLEFSMANLKLAQFRDSSTAGRHSHTTGQAVDVADNYDNDDSSEQVLMLPTRPEAGEGRQRQRVKSKIKTRRRDSRSVPTVASAGPSKDSSAESVKAGTTTTSDQSRNKEASPKLTDTVKEPSLAPDLGSTTSSPTTEHISEPTNDAQKITKSEGSDLEIEMEKLNIGADPVPICAGDTAIITDLLDGELAESIFEKIRDEIRWQKMSHQGGEVPRLVAVQGEVHSDGSIPIYRHPADESPPLLPFTPQVSLIRAEVEKKLGHTVNHVLIQFYRDGIDYISEHSDKTLDIVPNTYIANISLGAQRTMVFRTKRPPKNRENPQPVTEPLPPRQVYRAPLPHNSMCKMGLVTNEKWLHSIRQDKRQTNEKTPEELSYDGARISLTFRKIGTFLSKGEHKIWGQGATSKSKEGSKTVVNGQTPEAEKMLWAFGSENQSSNFDWKANYGAGFDVLHISNTRKLFLSGDKIEDMRVKIALAEFGVEWSEGKLSPPFTWKDGKTTSPQEPPVPATLPVKLIDNDLGRSTVIGSIAILLYLDTVYGSKPSISDSTIPPPSKSNSDLANKYTLLMQTQVLLSKWRATPFLKPSFRKELEYWESFVPSSEEGGFLAGKQPGIADIALWPVFWEIREEWRNREGLVNLVEYYWRLRACRSFLEVFGAVDEGARARAEAAVAVEKGKEKEKLIE